MKIGKMNGESVRALSRFVDNLSLDWKCEKDASDYIKACVLKGVYSSGEQDVRIFVPRDKSDFAKPVLQELFESGFSVHIRFVENINWVDTFSEIIIDFGS